MLWVEQPVGTGFSQGVSTETSQEAVAESFLGFFKNFADTFNFKNKKVYITGESYAGMYVPYIADAMFKRNDKTYYDVQGTMIYDPSINSDAVLADMPAVPYVKAFDSLFNLNDVSRVSSFTLKRADYKSRPSCTSSALSTSSAATKTT